MNKFCWPAAYYIFYTTKTIEEIIIKLTIKKNSKLKEPRNQKGCDPDWCPPISKCLCCVIILSVYIMIQMLCERMVEMDITLYHPYSSTLYLYVCVYVYVYV